MRRLLHHLACALALTINCPAWAAGAAHGAFESAGVPAGFADLASTREVLVDIYFGGRKVGEARALSRPGTLQFRAPAEVLAVLPGIIATPDVQASLAAELPTNTQAACSPSNSGNCGQISPRVVGIIYDEDHFRVDLFVNPRFLQTAHLAPSGYLPFPDSPLSLTSNFGLAAAGTIGGSSTYNVQNRTIVSLHNVRLRADTSAASHLGLLVDDLVAEADRKDLRYSAGLFWTPGNDFIGQRRIAGFGVGTQFDTWANQEELHGTPLILFLARPARVELLVDGRLVSSRSYGAGNVDLDTSALADGSYPVLLRIHEASGNVREEQRFFVKNAQIAPLGHPIFYAYGGILANTRRNRPISLSRTFYYQAGTAWRLGTGLALDASLLGTERKTIVEAGGWLIRGSTRLRAAGLVSTAGDSGALLQLAAGGHGPLNISFDLRRIWSHDGGPLVPLPTLIDSFGNSQPTGIQLASGSYTQAIGSVAWRVGSGYLSLVGTYRKDRHFRADYSIGPTVNWPLIGRSPIQLVLEASAQRTRTGTVAFAGVRALLTAGRVSMLARMGEGYQKDRTAGGQSVSRVIGSLNAEYSYEDSGRTLLQANAGFDRDISASTVHAGALVDSRFGNVRGDIVHDLEGNGATQYDVAYQSAVALSPHSAVWGARDVDQSAMVIALGGDARDASFNVLVDGVSRGQVKIGDRLSLFVPAYRTYKVRLEPTAPFAVSYDSSAREITLYPGNVKTLAWTAQSYFTIFAQAVSPAGMAIANSHVQSPKGIGETDSNGFFQLDVRHGDPVTVQTANGAECRIDLANVVVKNDLASLGRVICR